jgi:hypothetical protein
VSTGQPLEHRKFRSGNTNSTRKTQILRLGQ